MSGILDQYNNGMDLDSIFDGADQVESSGLDLDMFKGAKLDALQGIPFVITGGTFRESITPDGKVSDFATLVCVIASEKTLERKKVRYQGTEVWFPEQTFGINDGSTGIRRQVVSYLHGKGFIQVVEEGTSIVEDGARGDCTWDLMVSQWEKFMHGEPTTKQAKGTGLTLTSWEFQLPNGLVAPRGIRTSTYTGAFKREITTRYLA